VKDVDHEAACGRPRRPTLKKNKTKSLSNALNYDDIPVVGHSEIRTFRAGNPEPL
jgi:hypothetical protein